VTLLAYSIILRRQRKEGFTHRHGVVNVPDMGKYCRSLWFVLIISNVCQVVPFLGPIEQANAPPQSCSLSTYAPTSDATVYYQTNPSNSVTLSADQGKRVFFVKGHDVNYGNIRADALADAGRESDLQIRIDDEEWTNNHAALQDGARLQALEARHTYEAILRWHTKETVAIPHQEVLEEAKNRIEEITGLRPTNKKLLKGVKTHGIPPRLRDHTRNMLTSKIKCGTYWANIPGHTDKAFCSFCK